MTQPTDGLVHRVLDREEVLRRNVDVLVAGSTPSARALGLTILQTLLLRPIR